LYPTSWWQEGGGEINEMIGRKEGRKEGRKVEK
jgi:hypothetical protein